MDAAVSQDGHDHAADQRTQDGSFAAAQAASADHDRRDHLELEPFGRRWVACSTEIHELEGTGEPGCDAAQQVDDDLDRGDVDSAKACRRFVGTDRIDVPAQEAIAQQKRDQDAQDNQGPDAGHRRSQEGSGSGARMRPNHHGLACPGIVTDVLEASHLAMPR